MPGGGGSTVVVGMVRTDGLSRLLRFSVLAGSPRMGGEKSKGCTAWRLCRLRLCADDGAHALSLALVPWSFCGGERRRHGDLWGVWLLVVAGGRVGGGADWVSESLGRRWSEGAVQSQRNGQKESVNLSPCLRVMCVLLCFLRPGGFFGEELAAVVR